MTQRATTKASTTSICPSSGDTESRSGVTRDSPHGWGPITIWDLLEAVRRQWVVALVGVMLSVAGGYAAATVHGVWFEHAQVLLIAPQKSSKSNPLSAGSYSAAGLAGMIGRQVDHDGGGALAFSPTATIVDVGVRDGTWVRLRNRGSQWSPSFPEAELDVQVVGKDPERVRATMAATLARLNQVLHDDQVRLGVRDVDLLRSTLSPGNPPVSYQGSSRSRAVMAALILGFGLTVTSCVWINRWRDARRRRARKESRMRSGGDPRAQPAGAGANAEGVPVA
jgi:hypothetical protein